jgi:oligopeptide/dipeptide ABC transporter ATP-binding protein
VSAPSPAPAKLLEVRDLRTVFDIEGKTARAVDGVSFDIHEGEVFGLVGESGSGKSVTALSILKLIPDPPGKIAGGQVFFRGRDLLSLGYDEMRKIRGKDISMIFQEPMTSLNPVFTVGFQVREAITQHEPGLAKGAAHARAVEMLRLVGIPDAARRMDDYPHQFSGGMRQRVMIAMALALEPALLIADEPTTALDVTIQAQILELMLKVKSKVGNAAILLITHDLAVVAETCRRLAVMYGGKIQEVGDTKSIFKKPLHPYTKGLMGSIPRPDKAPKSRLQAIPGIVPSILDFPAGCKFCTRCPEKVEKCERVEPDLVEVEPGRLVRCHVVEEAMKGFAPSDDRGGARA